MAKRPFTFDDAQRGIKGTPHVPTDAEWDQMEAFVDFMASEFVAAQTARTAPGKAPGTASPTGPG